MTDSEPEGFLLTGRRALLLFASVLLLRMAIAAQFRGNFDSQSFLYSAEAAFQGENVYLATTRYNYSPIWAQVLAAVWRISRPNTALFILLNGFLQILVDVVCAALVLRIAERRLEFSKDRARRSALLFFSNPISVLVSGAQGQFDGVSVLFLLAAIYGATAPDFERRRGRVVALLALSVLVKHVTAFHPFVFWRRIRRPGLRDVQIALPYAVFFASFLPYVAASEAILHNVFLYSAGAERGPARPGGLVYFLDAASSSSAVFVLLFFGAVAWTVWATRDLELPRACLVLFLALLVFHPSYSAQYLVWPVALGSLYASAAFGVFSAIGALWHSSESLELTWPLRPSPYAAWVAAVVWFLLEIARLRRRSAGLRGGFAPNHQDHL